MKNKQKRINELVSEINKHDELYWKKNEPVISDVEYDKLVTELALLDPANNLLSKVHSSVASNKKIQHKIPMLSLDKVYSFEDLVKWCSKVARSKDEVFRVELKYDGVSGDLRDGVLATRGDGIVGEDVTDKLPLIKIISTTDSKDVRGEIVFTKIDFQVNKNRVTRKGGEPYKNERNAVGGILNRDDIDTNVGQILTLVDFRHMGTQLTFDKITGLGEEGLIKIENNMRNLIFPVDGIVFKIADLVYAESLGSTRHHSKSQVAYKFSNPFEFSEIESLTWSVGKHTITPIAHIKPIQLSGVTIKNVNLHNMKNIRDLDIHIGDTLKVERAGDVIPYATGIQQGQERGRIDITHCPSCGYLVEYREPEIVCINPNCPGMHLVNLMDSVVRIGIERLGEPTLTKMIETLDVHNLIDIFSLTKEDIIKLDGFAKSSTDNLFNEIQRVKKGGVFEWQILSCLNLEGIGTSLSQDLLKKSCLKEIRKYSIEQFQFIQGIGPERAKILCTGLKENESYIDNLLHILPIKQNEVKGDLIKICFTGKFPEKKSYYYDLIKNRGFEIWEKVTKDLDILVVSDPSKGSNKQKKAEKLGVKIISVEDLLKNINE